MLKQIVDLLPKLNKTELGELRARMNFLFGKSVDQPTEKINDFLEILVSVVQEEGLDQRNAKALRRSQNYGAFVQKTSKILERFPNDLTRIERRAIYRLGVKLLVERMLSMDIEVTGGSVMNHIHRLPAVLESSFPGYLRSGLIRLVINQETRI